MSHVDYVVVSNVIGDDLVLPDGTERVGILGGAATYAAAGMRIWSQHIGVVSGIGEDFAALYGGWFTRSGIDQQGLLIRDLYTPRSRILYQSHDSRTETPRFGPEHFRLMEPSITDLPPSYGGARGLYIFRNANVDFWREALTFRAEHPTTLIWEAHAGIANSASWGVVAEILSQIDLFSLNVAEAGLLCGQSEPQRIVEKLLATGLKGVALRAGSQGAYVADQHALWQIPTVAVNVVDVTGAGNAFTGGFLVGYCEDGELATAGMKGAVAASFMLEQFGPPMQIDAATRAAAEIRLRALEPIRLN